MKKILPIILALYILAVLQYEGVFDSRACTITNPIDQEKSFDPCTLKDVYCNQEEPEPLTIDNLEPDTTLHIVQSIFGEGWELAYAIMMAESGGNQFATNSNNNGSKDFGIWQINTIHNLPNECTLDVKCSTEFAYKLSKGGTNWTPWVAYNTGVYNKFL